MSKDTQKISQVAITFVSWAGIEAGITEKPIEKTVIVDLQRDIRIGGASDIQKITPVVDVDD